MNLPDADAAPLDPPNVWERLPGETPRAYAAFVAYRELGPTRSVRKLVQSGDERASNTRQLQMWSAEHAWPARAAAYDDQVAREAYEADVEAVRQMRARHAQAAVSLQTKALARLRDLDPKELAPRDLLAFIREAVTIERAARGVPDVAPVHAPAASEAAHQALMGDDESPVTAEEIRRLEQALAGRRGQDARADSD